MLKSSLTVGQSGACLPNCASFIYNNYNCKKFEPTMLAKKKARQGRGESDASREAAYGGRDS